MFKENRKITIDEEIKLGTEEMAQSLSMFPAFEEDLSSGPSA